MCLPWGEKWAVTLSIVVYPTHAIIVIAIVTVTIDNDNDDDDDVIDSALLQVKFGCFPAVIMKLLNSLSIVSLILPSDHLVL